MRLVLFLFIKKEKEVEEDERIEYGKYMGKIGVGEWDWNYLFKICLN